MTKRALAFALLTAAALTGCKSKTDPTPENYTAVLNAWFPDHPDCLLDGSVHFPLETSDPALTRQMDALAVAQIVEEHKDPALAVKRYTLTDAGTKAGRNLCFGHREITSIVSSTPPAPANGFTETQVTYQYKVEDLPVWAKTPQVVAAFPKLREEMTGDATGKATLALNRVSWSVPD